MPEPGDLCFSGDDLRFRVVLSEGAVRGIVDACIEAGRKETGGILVGRLEAEGQTARVVEATPRPHDSKFGWFWFRRGAAGLGRLLQERWNSGLHYLGEWHYHPGGSSEPSSADYKAMAAIAGDVRYQAPEPILAILGGDPGNSYEISVTVLPIGERPYQLRSRGGW